MTTRIEADDVLEVLDLPASAGVASWLDGGGRSMPWPGRQTRAHEDLDLVISLTDVAPAMEALQWRGGAIDED